MQNIHFFPSSVFHLRTSAALSSPGQSPRLQPLSSDSVSSEHAPDMQFLTQVSVPSPQVTEQVVSLSHSDHWGSPLKKIALKMVIILLLIFLLFILNLF